MHPRTSNGQVQPQPIWHTAASTLGEIPRARAVDESIAFLREGYAFGRRRFDRLQSDAFTTRLIGRRVTVVYGADAARMFYEGDRFSRDRAMPTSVLHLLQDERSVQTLEDERHHHRKTMFMQMLMPDSVQELVRAFDAEWSTALRRESGHTVSLYDLAVVTLTRSAAAWCGIPAGVIDLDRLSADLAAMVDRAGSFGPPNWAARVRRRRAESVMTDLVLDARGGACEVRPGTPLHRLATATEPDGRPLCASVAAVELLNVLRPVVAVSRFLVFAAHALHMQPGLRRPIADGQGAAVRFANEVRRRYPFFPVIGGTVRRPFTWRGRRFAPGEWVLLDLYATNHDRRSWSAPDRFIPGRFEDWNGDPNTPVPQGGGDVATGHRCPGEAATIALTAHFSRRIAGENAFTVPEQDLRISLRRMPALPQDRFLVTLNGDSS